MSPVNRRRIAFWAAAVVGSVAAGFLLCSADIVSWDDLTHLGQSRYLLSRVGLIPGPVDIAPIVRWYGPLWEFFLGLNSEFLFRSLKDPLLVRHALTFAWFPMTLLVLPTLLLRAGVQRATAVLAGSLLFGMIRLGGHAAVNVKDLPFACAFVLVTVYLWILLREGRERSEGRRYPVRELARLGVVALIPYLLRPPALIHFPLLLAFLALHAALFEEDPSWRRAILIPAALTAMGLLLVAALFPGIRDGGWRTWLSSFAGFSRFPWTGAVRAFGRSFPSTEVPAWYPFAWFPAILDPSALLVAAAGLTLTVFRPRAVGHPFRLDARGAPFDLSLRAWVGVVAFLSWGILLARRPVLYDEERHLLFLYPPVLVLAALGLDALTERSKLALSAVIAASSLISYAAWGRYSYVYKSPLVGDVRSSRFMGDYWGLCLPLAVRALDGRVPPSMDVLWDGPIETADAENARLVQSTLSRVPGFATYRFRQEGAFTPPFAAVASNRLGQHLGSVLRDVAKGRARLLWEGDMPPGEPACVLAEYLPIPRR